MSISRDVKARLLHGLCLQRQHRRPDRHQLVQQRKRISTSRLLFSNRKSNGRLQLQGCENRPHFCIRQMQVDSFGRHDRRPLRPAIEASSGDFGNQHVVRVGYLHRLALLLKRPYRPASVCCGYSARTPTCVVGVGRTLHPEAADCHSRRRRFSAR